MQNLNLWVLIILPLWTALAWTAGVFYTHYSHDFEMKYENYSYIALAIFLLMFLNGIVMNVHVKQKDKKSKKDFSNASNSDNS